MWRVVSRSADLSSPDPVATPAANDSYSPSTSLSLSPTTPLLDPIPSGDIIASSFLCINGDFNLIRSFLPSSLFAYIHLHHRRQLSCFLTESRRLTTLLLLQGTLLETLMLNFSCFMFIVDDSVVLTLSQFRNSICLGILNELLFSFFFFFFGAE